MRSWLGRPGCPTNLTRPGSMKSRVDFRTKYELKGYREGRRGHFFRLCA